nr:hypothetical protein [Tanacetum cinerariifolium]
MESLDEFKEVSGLVPSIPKSTIYFCNVANHVKLAILNFMPFAEGTLPEAINEAAKPKVSHEVRINDSFCSTNENGYFKDDIDLGQLQESNESEVEEVSMSFGKPGGGFLDDLEDDLDRYDGYEAHVYDLTEQEQALCDRYDIRLNGFLLGNNTAKKGGLASKGKNIEGKPLGDAEKHNATTRTQVTPKKVLVSALTNDEKVLGANVAILISVVDEIRDKFANTLYGYFVGERLAFPIVEAYVTNAWKKGFERILIFLNEWLDNTKLKEEVITKVPVSVKIHNVPVVAFSKTGLSLIATQLGPPIRLDTCTSDMCLNPWDRNSYARILVALNSENEIRKAVVSSSYRNGGVCDTNGKSKKKGAKKPVMKQEVNESINGSLLEQFLKSHDASMSKQNNFSKLNESEVEEVSMSFGKPGGGFLDDLKDDLDRYDGYEAHVYDLTEQEQALCDRYDIRLNGHCRK